MSALVKYDAARFALQQAVEIDEVKAIRDKAEAMAAYARQAKDTEMIQWVTEIKVRAERRAGQMLSEMPKSAGTKGQLHGKSSGGHIVVPPEGSTKTLADLGITKNESSRWQKLAAVDDERFEKAVSAAKEVAGEVTTAAMLRIEREPKATPASKPAPVLEAVSELPKKEAEAAAEQEDEYTEADALRDQVTELQDMLAVKGAPEEERETTETLVAGMREQIKTLTASLSAVSASRDGLMRTNAQLMKQVAIQRKEIDKLRSMGAVA